MTKNTPLILALLLGGAIVSGCGGGGGGPDTGGPVTPPPPPPVQPGLGVNDCAAKPQSLACTAGALVLSGPFAMFRYATRPLAMNGTAGGDSAAGPGVGTITQNAGSPGVAGDETYDWKLTLGSRNETFPTGPQHTGATLPLGIPAQRYYCVTGAQPCPPHDLYLLYPATTESGSLDYSLSFVSHTHAEPNTDYIFGVYGRETGAFSPAMQTGSAVYAGQTFGEVNYARDGVYTVKGRLWLNANFATGAITGAATDFQGHLGHIDSTSPLTTLPGKPDFDFAASLTSTTGHFTGVAASRAGGLGWTGTVIGSFFGLANTTPDEVGLSYILSGDDGSMIGAGVAGASPSAAAPPSAPGPNPITPPALTTPGCVQSACLERTATFFGPSAQLNRSNGNSGSNPDYPVPSYIRAADIHNVQSGVNVKIDPGVNTAVPTDTYTITYVIDGGRENFSRIFRVPAATAADGFGGQVKTASADDIFLTGTLSVYDVSSTLSRALDFVQIAAERHREVAQQEERSFIVFGRQTAPADMPTTGSAQFAGATRGAYVNGDRLYATASDISLNANFATGAVSGRASNFQFQEWFTGAPTTTPESLDFRYSGSIASATSTFSGTATSETGGLGLTGRVEGAFFGATGQAPDEAGLTYQLGTPESGIFMTGGAALGRQP